MEVGKVNNRTPVFPSRQRGTETVEFALTATLVFILLFGIIEFGLVLFDKATLANASREGARVGILYRDYWDGNGDPLPRDAARVEAVEDALVEQAVLNYAQSYVISPGGASALDAADVTITRDYGADGIFNVGDQISVHIDYGFSFLVLPHLVEDMVLNKIIPAETVMFAE
jgi:hypothetical protein